MTTESKSERLTPEREAEILHRLRPATLAAQLFVELKAVRANEKELLAIVDLYREEHRSTYPGGCFSTFGDPQFSVKYDHRCALCKRVDRLTDSGLRRNRDAQIGAVNERPDSP